MTRPRVDHIGIIVPDLESAVERFTTLFPEGPSTTVEMTDVGLRAAKFEAENVTIELLQYVTDEGAPFRGDGDGEALARATMGPDNGFNHISLEVGDIDEALVALAAVGFEPQAGFPRPGVHGTIAFMKRDEETGLLLEVSQPDDKA